MRHILIGASVATILFLSQASATDQAEKAKAAESKAEVLEEKASGKGDQAIPQPAEKITKPEVQAVDPTGKEPLNEAIICLARTIYWESRGEDSAGMEAIANMVMNRVGHEGFPKTICGVVKQGHEQGACQFSWWCDGRPDKVQEQEPYARAKEIARKALNGELEDRTHGAIYFHHQRSAPSWAKEYIETAKVGEHIFYKPPGGKAK